MRVHPGVTLQKKNHTPRRLKKKLYSGYIPGEAVAARHGSLRRPGEAQRPRERDLDKRERLLLQGGYGSLTKLHHKLTGIMDQKSE